MSKLIRQSNDEIDKANKRLIGRLKKEGLIPDLNLKEIINITEKDVLASGYCSKETISAIKTLNSMNNKTSRRIWEFFDSLFADSRKLVKNPARMKAMTQGNRGAMVTLMFRIYDMMKKMKQHHHDVRRLCSKDVRFMGQIFRMDRSCQKRNNRQP